MEKETKQNNDPDNQSVKADQAVNSERSETSNSDNAVTGADVTGDGDKEEVGKFSMLKRFPMLKRKAPLYGIAILIVVIIFFGVLYLLEREGRSSTTVFASIIKSQNAKMEIATVNGAKITNSDLQKSIDQISQMAVMQGEDTSDPQIAQAIREQAMEALINLELLRQEAKSKGISASEEDIKARHEELKEQLGEEALSSRMKELGLDEAGLLSEIAEEIVFQSLIESKIEEKFTAIDEAEVLSIYQQAKETGQELPPIEEVRDMIISQTEEAQKQEIVQQYLSDLRSSAKVEILQ